MADSALFSFFETLRRRWRVTLLVAVPLFAGAAWYAESLPAQYDAGVVVAFTPTERAAASGDAVRLQLPKYTTVATSSETLDRVASRLGVPRSRLDHAVNAIIPSDTATMSVTVRSTSPALSASVANEIADEVVDFSRSDSVLSADVVAAAVPENNPAAPPRRLLEAAALLAAVLVGVGAALVSEQRQPRLQTMADVGRHLSLRVLGRVPSSAAVRVRPLTAINDPVIGSAIRSLRTNMDRESRDQPVHVLSVTSSHAGEGKTTLASLLAVSLARLDVRVLLIDADLVRPRQAARFDVQPSPGLVDVLLGDAPLEKVVHEVASGLWLLPAVPSTEGGDVIARRFADVLSEARGIVDVVVVDTPPILGNDVGATVAAIAGTALFVTRRGTTVSEARQALSSLHGLNVRVIGVAVNGFRDSGEAYYLSPR